MRFQILPTSSVPSSGDSGVDSIRLRHNENVSKSESQKIFLIFLAENLNPLVTAPRPSCIRERKISRFVMRAKMKSKLNADTEYKTRSKIGSRWQNGGDGKRIALRPSADAGSERR